jgi:hypothetical protein
MAKKIVRKVVKPFSNDWIYDNISSLVDDAFNSKTRDVFTMLAKGGLSRDQLLDAMSQLSGESFNRVSTIVDTGLSVIGRERINDFAQGLGLEWYRYIGGTIGTSRAFCVERDGGYFHQSEVEDWADEDWDGKIPDTTAETIFSYCGGYNCRHELIPVPEDSVPADVKQFNLEQRQRAQLSKESLELDAELEKSQAKATTQSEALKLTALAKEVGPELDASTRAIASRYDNTNVTPLNYKSYESILRKSNDELDGFIMGSRGVKDGVRNTIVTDGKQIEKIAYELERDKKTIRFKKQDFTESSGYRGYLVNSKLSNGVWAETQLNTPEMIFAKESPNSAKAVIGEARWNAIAQKTGQQGGLGHTYYEELRKVGITKEEKAAWLQKSRDYYKNFYYSYPKKGWK